MDKSFTYMICSDDRKNTTLPADTYPIFYNIDFGGFGEEYDNYMCEVVSLGLSGGTLGSIRYIMMVCENLSNDGYFCRNKLSSNNVILSIIPMSAVQDSLLQSDGGNVKFRVNNCRIFKEVKFYFLRPDFTPVLVGGDLNNGGTETNWILTLKMTPIIN
jgi:hypothetical protein